MRIPQRPRRRWRLIVMTAALAMGTVTPAPGTGQGDACFHGRSESAYHRARRETAIRFIEAVNQAERLLRLKQERFAPLPSSP